MASNLISGSFPRSRRTLQRDSRNIDTKIPRAKLVRFFVCAPFDCGYAERLLFHLNGIANFDFATLHHTR